MNRDYYRYLCCPKCEGELDLEIIADDETGIEVGDLTCRDCRLVYPIIDYIPRFVPSESL